MADENVTVVGLEPIVEGMRELRLLMKDARPFIKRYIMPLLRDAESYTRPDRFKGLRAKERHGDVVNWSPGYSKYTTARMQKNGFVLRSRRPYHPALKDEVITEIATRLSVWLLSNAFGHGDSNG